MPKSSPVKPLHGKSLMSQRQWMTVFDADGTPRENRVRAGRGHSDPTHATALRLIRAQATRRTTEQPQPARLLSADNSR
jgi:hypothetical protein